MSPISLSHPDPARLNVDRRNDNYASPTKASLYRTPAPGTSGSEAVWQLARTGYCIAKVTLKLETPVALACKEQNSIQRKHRLTNCHHEEPFPMPYCFLISPYLPTGIEEQHCVSGTLLSDQ
jgi:hypothetical protein